MRYWVWVNCRSSFILFRYNANLFVDLQSRGIGQAVALLLVLWRSSFIALCSGECKIFYALDEQVPPEYMGRPGQLCGASAKNSIIGTGKGSVEWGVDLPLVGAMPDLYLGCLLATVPFCLGFSTYVLLVGDCRSIVGTCWVYGILR
jgi:hypothetical protein